jgi:hypothetical protein
MKPHKLYVLVRKDLECSTPAVQAGHVVAEFCLDSDLNVVWNNNYLIYLEVPDLEHLEYWMFKFQKRNIPISYFKEPDLNYEITAFCGLVDDEDAGFLSDLKLLE